MKTFSELGQFSVRVLEHSDIAGSERGALVTICKTAIYVGFIWGRAKFQKGAGFSKKENSSIKEEWNPSVHHAIYSSYYEETEYFASPQ